MRIKNIRLNKFRNYFYENVDFNEDINIFLGDNAQGKTNLLESVYYLANAKSFKSIRDKDLIMFSESSMKLSGTIKKDLSYKKISIDVNKDGNKDIFVNEVKYEKNKDLKALFKLVLFTPEDMNIIKDGPGLRRDFFDDIIVSVDYSYKILKKNFDKVIFQRNKFLKNRPGKFFEENLSAYDKQLVKMGYKIYLQRKKYIKIIETLAIEFHKSQSKNKENLEIIYRPDISSESLEDYEKKFLESRDNDLRYQTTTSGINRDNIEIKINEKEIKKFGSQGQQRSAILNIKLAQVKLIEKAANEKAIILFDDVFSELDENRSQFLLNNLGSFQTIISATNIKSLENIDKSKVRRISRGHIE